MFEVCALRVGVKTLHNTQCQLVVLIPILVLLLCEPPLFGTVEFA